MADARRMRAVVIREPGDADVLTLREVPLPEPGRGEVRVRVAASGVNRADLIQRQGRYPAPPGWPRDIPGLEFSGTVEALGRGVDGVEAGDRVMGIVGGGGCAEFLVTRPEELVRVPAGTELEEAGAIPEVFMTAFDAVLLQMELGLGELLLIHAVGSGVGTAALQLALSAGTEVVGTSRTPEKLDRARKLGLETPVEGGEGWAERLLAATGGRRPDVILDLVGGAYLAGNQEVLAERGRWIVVGVPGGAKAEVDLRRLMGRRASITGTVLRARPPREKAVLARAFDRRVVPLFEAGRLRPVVDTTFGPHEVAEAHRRMEANLNFGKLLVVWS